MIENIISATYLYDIEGVNKTHIKVEIGSNRFMNIPINNDNIDYQYMLDWVAAGNTITDPGEE